MENKNRKFFSKHNTSQYKEKEEFQIIFNIPRTHKTGTRKSCFHFLAVEHIFTLKIPIIIMMQHEYTYNIVQYF